MGKRWTRPDDEADVCTSNDGLVDQHVSGRVSEKGKGGISDGSQVGVFAEPEVFFPKYAMINARGA